MPVFCYYFVMPHLKNPGGRIVAIDDKDQYEKLLKQGFTTVTPEEELSFIQSRYRVIEEMKRNAEFKPEENENGLYIATVSQGGKDGYGVSSAKLMQELRMLGLDVSTTYKKQKIGILYHNPYSILRLETPVRMIYTMFESDKLPDDWRDYLEAADLILVPSKWCASIFKKFGFDARVVPLGYDDRVYVYKERENKRKMRKNFTFLHYNAFNVRKGFLEVFKAFTQAFDKAEPVRLIFKTTLNQIPGGFPLIESQYPNIEVITGSMEEHEMVDLCHRSDCFVFPSRGEGFGLTPLEAMATGMPAIVPNAHGITEYFNSEYMYEVKVKETCPAIYSRYKGVDTGKMVVCDVDHLAQQMRYIYEHQEEAIEMGQKASEYVKKWTFQNSAKLLKDVIDEYTEKPITEKPTNNILRLEEFI